MTSLKILNLRKQKVRIVTKMALKAMIPSDEIEAEKLRKEIRELGEEPCA